jgi:cold shock CspA family protein
MKGKVLGFDPATGTGAINGDDGKRYRFTAADNKGQAPLKANDTVDFEAANDVAKEIYAVKSSFTFPTGVVGNAAGNGSNYVQIILGKPHVIWAVVIILGSLIAGYFGALNALGHMSGAFGSGFGISAIFIALLFGIPVVAAVLIFFELTNRPNRAQFRLITAAVAIGGPILLPVIAGLVAPEALKGMSEFGAAFGGAGRMGILDFVGFRISLGMLITIAGGVLIILTNAGIVKLPKD